VFNRVFLNKFALNIGSRVHKLRKQNHIEDTPNRRPFVHSEISYRILTKYRGLS